MKAFRLCKLHGASPNTRPNTKINGNNLILDNLDLKKVSKQYRAVCTREKTVTVSFAKLVS